MVTNKLLILLNFLNLKKFRLHEFLWNWNISWHIFPQNQNFKIKNNPRQNIYFQLQKFLFVKHVKMVNQFYAIHKYDWKIKETDKQPLSFKKIAKIKELKVVNEKKVLPA
jgi:hypothetical protein